MKNVGFPPSGGALLSAQDVQRSFGRVGHVLGRGAPRFLFVTSFQSRQDSTYLVDARARAGTIYLRSGAGASIARRVALVHPFWGLAR
jgi:hypothetical protein